MSTLPTKGIQACSTSRVENARGTRWQSHCSVEPLLRHCHRHMWHTSSSRHSCRDRRNSALPTFQSPAVTRSLQWASSWSIPRLILRLFPRLTFPFSPPPLCFLLAILADGAKSHSLRRGAYNFTQALLILMLFVRFLRFFSRFCSVFDLGGSAILEPTSVLQCCCVAILESRIVLFLIFGWVLVTSLHREEIRIWSVELNYAKALKRGARRIAFRGLWN